MCLRYMCFCCIYFYSKIHCVIMNNRFKILEIDFFRLSLITHNNPFLYNTSNYLKNNDHKHSLHSINHKWVKIKHFLNSNILVKNSKFNLYFRSEDDSQPCDFCMTTWQMTFLDYYFVQQNIYIFVTADYAHWIISLYADDPLLFCKVLLKYK